MEKIQNAYQEEPITLNANADGVMKAMASIVSTKTNVLKHHVMTMPSVRIPLAIINAHVKMDILDWKTRTMLRCHKCAVESPCADNAACINIEGSFQCRCPSSYIIADDGVNCIDDDECRYTGMCHSNADCTNTDGLYECCPDGFFGDGN